MNTIFRPTLASDIYSLAMTLFEIVTSSDPFSELVLPDEQDVNPSSIRMYVQRNGRPEFPEAVKEDPNRAKYIDLIEECWSQRPEDRITISMVREKLGKIDALESMPPSPAGSRKVCNRFLSHP